MPDFDFRTTRNSFRWIRYARTQRAVRTSAIVMSHPLAQNRAQMYLRQRNHPIETLSSYRPDHALESSGGDPGDTVRPAALAEPDLESYPIRLPA